MATKTGAKDQTKGVSTLKPTTGALSMTKQDVPKMIDQLKAQLETLKGNNRDKISLDVKYNGTNIKDVKTVKELLEISASVQARGKAYSEEVIRFKLQGKVQEFTTSDKTVEEWNLIIDKAINELINSTQIAKLESAIKKLSSHLDENTKLQNELAEIMGDASAPLL